MDVTLHTEIRCGSCGTMMQYHQDDKVRCMSLRCEQRLKEYHAPKVSLVPVESEEEKPRRGRKPKATQD